MLRGITGCEMSRADLNKSCMWLRCIIGCYIQLNFFNVMSLAWLAVLQWWTGCHHSSEHLLKDVDVKWLSYVQDCNRYCTCLLSYLWRLFEKRGQFFTSQCSSMITWQGLPVPKVQIILPFHQPFRNYIYRGKNIDRCTEREKSQYSESQIKESHSTSWSNRENTTQVSYCCSKNLPCWMAKWYMVSWFFSN